MSDLKITHQSVHDYIAAKKRGDRATAERITREIVERNRNGANPSELSQLSWANASTPLGEGV